MATCEGSASLCYCASVDAGIAVPIISRPCFEVSHNRGPTLNELQSVVMCMFIFAKAGQNIILLPVRCLCRGADWENSPLKELSYEFDILRLIVRVFLRCRGQTDTDAPPLSCQTAELILEHRNDSPSPRHLWSTAATTCFLLSKQRRFSSGHRSKAIRSAPAILFVL